MEREVAARRGLRVMALTGALAVSLHTGGWAEELYSGFPEGISEEPIPGYENFPKAEIRNLNGAAALFVNGEPSVRIAIASTSDHSASLAEKLDCGMELVHTQSIRIGGPSLREAAYGETDWSMTKILDAIPDAQVIIRLNVHPYADFLAENPGAWVTGANGEQVFQERFNRMFEGVPEHRPSWASLAWRAYVDREIRDYLEFLASRPYAKNIVGINFLAGHSGEFDQWFGGEGWPGGNQGDWSEHSTSHFRDWLRQRYGNDEAALREAWYDPEVTFETAEISRDPYPWDLVAGSHDPVANRARMDYNDFHRLQIHETIQAWSRSAKLASGNRLVTGATWAVHDGGERLMNTSPWVDFGSGPGTYFYREPGNHRRLDFVGEDLRQHGKWFFEEMDMRTLFYQAEQYGVETMEKTLSVLARTHAQITIEAVGGYWYEFRSATYRHPAIWRMFRRQAAISELAASEPRDIPAEIAVIGSSCELGRGRGDLRTNILSRLGAPYHSLFLETLMEKDIDLSPYKLVIINSIYTLNEAEREWLKEKLFSDGRWVVFLRPTGAFAPDGDPVFDIANAGELMGFSLAPKSGNHREETQLFVSQDVIPGLAVGEELATEEEDKPREARRTAATMVDDSTAIPLTEWENGETAAAIKRHDDWTAIYVPSVRVGSGFLRAVAAAAGVHQYVPGAEEVVYAGGNLLNIHARDEGVRQIRLREPADLYDLYAERFIGRGQKEYDVPMDALSNHLFYLGDPREKLAEIDAMLDEEILERRYLQEERRMRRLEEQTSLPPPGPHSLLPGGQIRHWLFAGPLALDNQVETPDILLDYEEEQLRLPHLTEPLGDVVPKPFARLTSSDGKHSFAWRPLADGNARFYAADYYTRADRNQLFYVACYLESENGGDYVLHLRTERGHQLYLDGEKIGESFYPKGREEAQPLDFPIHLEPGRRHSLLFKVFSAGGGNTGWRARLYDPDGEPARDVGVFLMPE